MTLERDSFFEKAYLQYFSKVQHFAYSYLNDNEGANSVAQEVFMSVWEDKHKFSQEKDILGYLIVLTRNRCLNILRKRVIEEKFKSNRSKQLMDQINYHALSNNAVSSLLEKEVSTIVTSTLNKMPYKVKATFLLSRSGKLKQHEIASLQGIAIRTVESRLKKAITILKKSLKDYLTIALFLSIIDSLIKS